ncbi:MAG: FkbM family methyltransferase [Thermoanaerobaculia bacterium]
MKPTCDSEEANFMYLEHLVTPYLALLSSPRCFLTRLIHPDLVSFGLFANIANVKKRGLFKGIDGVIDVGANIGQFAYMVHTVLPQLPIYSFEPDKQCFIQLQHTFERFQIPGKCFSIAISDQRGHGQFYIYTNRANNSFLLREDSERESAQATTVPCNTLDGLERELRVLKCPMLKIDVQGYEMAVLRGATSLLERCKYVLLEVSFRFAYQGNAHVADIFAMMRERGFVCLDILDILRMPRDEGFGLREADLLFVNESLERS